MSNLAIADLFRRATLPALISPSQEMLCLDALRFVAACGIVLLHSKKFLFVSTSLRPSDELALFVDLFFTISGFVIAYVYDAKLISIRAYGTFLQRRVGRLVPLHWLTLIVALLVWSGVVLLGASTKHLPSFRPFCIGETVFLVHALVDRCDGRYFNDVSWSISVEMAMYVLFPVAAVIGRRSGYLLAVVALLALAGVTVSLIDESPSIFDVKWLALPPLTRGIASFLVGVAFCYNQTLLRGISRADIWFVASVVLVIPAILWGLPQIFIIPMLYAVVAFAISADLNGIAPRVAKVLAPLGLLTYSIYMWHGIIILLVLNAIGDKLIAGAQVVRLLLAAICYATIFIVAYSSYFWLETPARKWVDGLKLFG